MIKKLQSFLLVSAFLFSSMPLSPAQATTCPTLSPGDRFTVPVASTAVYVLNSNKERLYFPNSDVYHSWYANFDGIVQLDPTCVSAYPAATNPSGVNYRPGSRLVKTPLDTAVYAIGPGNERMRIKDENAARTLYGNNWGSLVRDVHDLHWTNYADSSDVVDGSTIPDGMLVRSSDSPQVYYVEDGELTPVSISDSFLADDIHTIADTLINRFSKKSTIVDSSTVLEDPVQKQDLSPLKTYRNVAHGVSFQYPRSWILSDYTRTTNYWRDDITLSFALPVPEGKTPNYVSISVTPDEGDYPIIFTSSQEYIDFLTSLREGENDNFSYESLPDEVKETVTEEEYNAFVELFEGFIEAFLSGVTTTYEKTTVIGNTIPALDILTVFEDKDLSATYHMFAFWHKGLIFDIIHTYDDSPSAEEVSDINALIESFTFFTPDPTPEPPAPSAEDLHRLSDIKQIQTALELFYTDNDHYPISTSPIDLGRNNVDCLDGKVGFKTGCDPYPYQYTIMGLVPHDPADNKQYTYTSTLSGDSYTINFTLDGQVYSFRGDMIATPSGIRSAQEI